MIVTLLNDLDVLYQGPGHNSYRLLLSAGVQEVDDLLGQYLLDTYVGVKEGGDLSEPVVEESDESEELPSQPDQEPVVDAPVDAPSDTLEPPVEEPVVDSEPPVEQTEPAS